MLASYAVDLREAEKWRALAECRGAPMEWFVGDPSPPAEAFALCDRCCVAGECLAFGEEEHKRNGVVAIYGGKLFYQRNRGGRPREYDCGTPQARRRHKRRGETCSECQAVTAPATAS